MMRRDRFLTSLVALALVMAGCGGGSDVETSPSDGAGSPTDSADDGDSGTDEPGDEAETDGDDGDETDETTYEYESPLGEFLGWIDVDFDEEEFRAEELARMARVEELTAACMREQGFEYIPVDHSQFWYDEDEFAGEEQWGTSEWIRTYGFGVTTMRFSQEQVGPDLVGYDPHMYEGPEEEFVDPNQDYRDSLSEPERQACDEALSCGGP